ncbi:2-hydroxy-6-oxo-6-phenylhexa-2,4-dienoate hydrolase (plasmid) [Rhodococcus sp. WAY2]|uniref:2-hydroxy-6-oxo-6-phenylhexa-2, 4-dionoate hydrolase n=3 Tax=Rhodococcus TaxID=1827 RepID=A3KD02_RHOER|nr:2-hydroxy-6-oxo-6-phenylhexa-2,4-dienoate hydrolase [Rhodococcus sp. WAY2]BAF48497.1 2-hydroxy-6-oxo-6-phenylhexa-2, 4-dionoate hydrolase [Rhodococcus rhodochrous]BAF48509.1 2-hydroxy-6-oxo-6-phenylhexa-2, 4-dionoate hydrolase [Rhodococcus erythropolis]BAF48526.1 2-hydroxy-6-oxo-6-phenylhexa-2, 4-dionoate hydrolase [Rhodococcus sp. HA99]
MMGDTHIGPTNLASRTVAVQGTKLHFHEAGVGETLVLLHGGGPGASGWSNFGGNVAALAEQFHVVVPDQPGYGLADKPEFDGDYWTFAARCIADLLSSLGVEKAHFVGNSMGGGTTVRLALDRPDCIDRMILMGPAGVSVNVVTPHPSEGLKILSSFYDAPGPSRDRMAAFIRMMVFDPAMVTDELITERLEAAMDPDARAGALRAVRSIMSSPDAELWRHLHEVQHETLLVWGRDDRVVPMDGGLFALQRMPNADLHVFSRCGHWAQAERRDEFNRLAIDFFTR